MSSISTAERVITPRGLEMPEISKKWKSKVFDFKYSGKAGTNSGELQAPLTTREDFLGQAIYAVPVLLILVNTMPWAEKSELEVAKDAIICPSLSSSLACEFELDKCITLPSGRQTSDEILGRVWMRYMTAIFEEHGMDAVQVFLSKVLKEHLESVVSKARDPEGYPKTMS